MPVSDEWREFEMLVARIEEAAADRGAVVRSPDRIRDLITGKMREVDASIRQIVGTTNVLVTIECRKRSCKADDRWIEELGTKRNKIGAAQTIAVSEKGFTSSAHKSAKHYGIDLRTLSEVSGADIEDWFLPGRSIHVFRLIDELKCIVSFYDGSEDEPTHGFHVPDEAAVFHFHKQPTMTPRDLVLFFEQADPDRFPHVPFDGTRVDLDIPMSCGRGTVTATTSEGEKEVRFIQLTAKISYQSSVCDVEDGKHHEYKGADGSCIQHTAFDTELDGTPVKFEHQSNSSGGHSVSVRFSPKEADPNEED